MHAWCFQLGLGLRTYSCPIQPPASFPIHPYIASLAPPPLQPSTSSPTTTKEQIKHPSLIEKYNLTAAVRAQDKGKAREDDGEVTETAQSRAWNADKAAREKTLQDRKAKMILEARQ
jgi:cation transport regulator ChaB